MLGEETEEEMEARHEAYGLRVIIIRASELFDVNLELNRESAIQSPSGQRPWKISFLLSAN
jgi:hypothetical protein